MLVSEANTSALSPDKLLEAVRWHITRAESQRNGMWTRAAASLSGNALIIAGAAIVASSITAKESTVGSAGGRLGAIVAVLALLTSMLSVYAATRAFGGIYPWSRVLRRAGPDSGILYSLLGTVNSCQDHEHFKSLVLRRSTDAEIEGAILEFWRISYLHRGRINALNASLLLFAASGFLLVTSLAIVFVSTVIAA
jgi:hypothetical protein